MIGHQLFFNDELKEKKFWWSNVYTSTFRCFISKSSSTNNKFISLNSGSEIPIQKAIYLQAPLSYLFTAAMRELDFVLIAKIAKMKAIRFTSQGFSLCNTYIISCTYVQNVYILIKRWSEAESFSIFENHNYIP